MSSHKQKDKMMIDLTKSPAKLAMLKKLQAMGGIAKSKSALIKATFTGRCPSDTQVSRNKAVNAMISAGWIKEVSSDGFEIALTLTGLDALESALS